MYLQHSEEILVVYQGIYNREDKYEIILHITIKESNALLCMHFINVLN